MAWKVREGAVLQMKLSDNLGLEETLSCEAHLDASQAAPLYPVGLAQTWMCDRQNLLKELEKAQRDTSVAFFSKQIFFPL